ncbi:hypothetical protein AVEN_273988-1, partial [Araneus ventricosus]
MVQSRRILTTRLLLQHRGFRVSSLASTRGPNVSRSFVLPLPSHRGSKLESADVVLDSTSVTEHPLPPAMREIKSNQTSTFLPASSSLYPFLWRWKVSFHQFNIQLRLLSSPSSPNELRTALVVLSGLSSKIHRVSPSDRVPSANSNSKSNFLKQ